MCTHISKGTSLIFFLCLPPPPTQAQGSPIGSSASPSRGGSPNSTACCPLVPLQPWGVCSAVQEHQQAFCTLWAGIPSGPLQWILQKTMLSRGGHHAFLCHGLPVRITSVVLQRGILLCLQWVTGVLASLICKGSWAKVSSHLSPREGIYSDNFCKCWFHFCLFVPQPCPLFLKWCSHTMGFFGVNQLALISFSTTWFLSHFFTIILLLIHMFMWCDIPPWLAKC